MHDNSVLTLLHKQLTDQLEPPDKELLLDWLENSSRNVEEQRDVSKIWELSGNYDPPFKPDVNKSFEKFSKRLKADAVPPQTNVIPLNPIRNWMKFAAIGVVLLGAIFVWQLSRSMNVEQVIVSTISNEVKALDLEDGSKVWINEKSSFSYPDKFVSNERIVTLDGEAFFDVAGDASRPFTIKGGEADVSVLGTSFSFDTNNPNGLMEVEVREGTVEIRPNGSSQTLVLTKNEKGFYDPQNKKFLEKELLSVSNADFFVTNKYRFVNSKYTFVFEVLSRVYDVDFVFGNEGLEDCEFTSPIEFDRNNIQSTINVIETAYSHKNLKLRKVSDVRYEITGDPCN
jgi:ferric-dicitrate binding protein FerR (iron transport regulator)